MIVEPNVQALLKILDIDSRYTLVVATAKRARNIVEENPDIEKNVSMAVKEISKGKIIVHAPEKIDEYDVYAEYTNGNK